MRATLTWLLAAGALVACGSEGPPNPAPLANQGGAAPTSEPKPPPAPAKRTVSTRNPWGGPPSNLLVDGDFEFSIGLQGSSQQTGWRAFTSNVGLSYLYATTGGLCRTGLRCAVMRADQFYFGRGASANGVGMRAELWAKVPEGRDCETVSQIYFDCFFENNAIFAITSESLLPDESGWCRYRGVIPEQTLAMCSQVQNTLVDAEVAILDSATLIPNDGTVVLPAPPAPHAGAAPLRTPSADADWPTARQTTLPPDRARDMRAMLKRLRDQTPFGPDKPAVGADSAW
jgi:hypothetical protein